MACYVPMRFCSGAIGLHFVLTLVSIYQSKELIITKQLNEAEVATLEYLHILESYYPLQSYDHAYESRSKSTPRLVLNSRIK